MRILGSLFRAASRPPAVASPAVDAAGFRAAAPADDAPADDASAVWRPDVPGADTGTVDAPVFHVEQTGRLGNVMIQYMVALKFADLVGNCRISNISLPEWGISHASIDPTEPVALERQEQHINLPRLAEQALSGQISRIDWKGFGQRMENFLPPERYHDVFVSPFETPMGFGPEFLVCPVRAEDILNTPNPDYVLTPVEFYRDIVEMTGLSPVFIGQTQANAYTDRIRAAFPEAIFREPQANPLVDFETIRQSRNAVIGVSTYAWVSAWLSRSLENVYLAVSGLFNPMQKPQVNLLPYGDPRFKFFQFPINYAVPLERHAAAHQRIAPFWRLVAHKQFRQLFENVPRFERNLADGLAIFDEAFYLATNQDVAAAAQRHGEGFARAHYFTNGFHERRLPVDIDYGWYAREYPLAAFEVAQGDYLDFTHHYMAIGKSRGYAPAPSPRQILTAWGQPDYTAPAGWRT